MIDGPFLQAAAAAAQDTAAAPPAPFEGVDSVVVESPLPGGVAAVVRFLLDVVPWWVQLAGVVAGVVVAIALVILAVRRRSAIAAWLASRRRWVKWALAAGIVLAVAAGGRLGATAWQYTQHDNGFCTGCHVMDPAFQEFVNFRDKHDTLSCHDCHQQSVFASARQLYLWVAERPEEIRPHAKVPNAVCMKCHVIEGDTAVWQRIASTAGHRVHLESDDRSLADLQCVTCHSAEVHRFVPAPATCGQAGCHRERETTIVLGKMAGQAVGHCVACHRYTADVPLLATRDSARGTLVPASPQCLGCHEMRAVLADFDPALDPHAGTCGTCHNPHEHATPGAAITTCASAGCHDDWRTEAFHVGREHKKGAEQCLTCHLPHRAKVDASDCESCHAGVRQRTARRPPLPFDTLRALRRTAPLPDPPAGEALRGWGDAPPEDEPSGGLLLVLGVGVGLGPGGGAGAAAPARQDTFSHARHRAVACLECHTSRASHGRLTFVPPRGCDICHHQAPDRGTCAECHQAGELEPARPVAVRVAIPTKPPKPREVGFSHPAHAARRCVECHTAPVTLAPAPATAECRSCHEDHHGAERNCAACHSTGDIRAQHDPKTAHERCDACHTRRTVALLTPTRPFCAACHETQRANHYEPKQCTVCHFLSEPAAFRAHLLTTPVSR